MLWYVYAALEGLGKDLTKSALTVVGYKQEMLRQAFPGREDGFVVQAEQLGTGHALMMAMPALESAGSEYALVVNGDTPLLPADRLRAFVQATMAEEADIAFMTITPADPGAFGRVPRGSEGGVEAIVEFKDFDPAHHGPDPREVNAGIYLLRRAAIAPLLDRLSNDNKSGEYYITDLIGLGVASHLKVFGFACGDAPQLMGVNSPLELAAAEDFLAQQLASYWLSQGVMVRNPMTARIGPRCFLEPGCEIVGPCELTGRVAVAKGARIEAFTSITDSALAEDCRIRNFSHLEGAEVGPECVVGPYGRLRPGAVLKKGAKVGNFVEMKKAVLGEGAKASHLTYLGDAEVGEGTNIGAGTITCNYDGKSKHKTVVGKNVFIGSNSALVAPISLGDGVLVAAGSTLTEDGEAERLVIARSRQTVKERKK
jgi:bifunctional UDP-N-acetylglucosamine pyrophosphorylase/glucosamine-1-phosphate N-acetyltransferase